MWKRYTFADGTFIIVRGMSATEKKIEIAKHGKIIKIEKI